MVGLTEMAFLATGPALGIAAQRMAESVAHEEGIEVTHRYARYVVSVVAGVSVPIWASTLPATAFLAACVLGWLLVAIFMVDWATMLIPRWLTIALIISGLAMTWLLIPEALKEHTLAVLIGWTSFQLIIRAYRRLRGQDGLGAGDAALLAGAAAWVGPAALPGLVVVAASVSLLTHLVTVALTRSKLSLSQRMPFGPFLAVATWLTWTVGPIEFA